MSEYPDFGSKLEICEDKANADNSKTPTVSPCQSLLAPCPTESRWNLYPATHSFRGRPSLYPNLHPEFTKSLRCFYATPLLAASSLYFPTPLVLNIHRPPSEEGHSSVAASGPRPSSTLESKQPSIGLHCWHPASAPPTLPAWELMLVRAWEWADCNYYGISEYPCLLLGYWWVDNTYSVFILFSTNQQ